MRPNTPDDEDDEKLIPEWGLGADDQIIWAGLGVLGVMLLFFGWNWWQGGDNETLDVVGAPLTSLVATGAGIADDTGLAEGAAAAAAGTGAAAGTDDEAAATTTTEAEAAATSTTEAPTTTTTEAPTTTEPQIGDVNAAVAGLPGAITGSNDGATAVLEGFVANQGESDAAEAEAGAVEGIESVDNRLQLLESPVAAALGDAGVVDAAVSGEGTVMTVTGTLQSEEERAPALAAASEVEGVTEVIDELTVSVVADLNALPQVQFAYNSAQILPESTADLDTAAELIQGAEGVQLRVEGYTDTDGDDTANQLLSERRANAVRDYLVGAGVDAAALEAQGFGETTKFAEGESAEAKAENRRVVFVDVG